MAAISRAIFFGTPEFAVPCLRALCDVADVVRVVTQPDRPAGRGMKLAPPPVKQLALERGLEVVQPTKVRTPEFAEQLRALHADVALVVAYGRILPAARARAPRARLRQRARVAAACAARSSADPVGRSFSGDVRPACA